MNFHSMECFWVTNFGLPDISLGIHVCMAGRIDLHIGWYMISIGKVPIYKDRNGKLIAVANSYHKTKRMPIRASNP